MGSLTQSDFTQAASRMLREAKGGVVRIVDGEREIGALVSTEYMAQVKQMAWKRMDELSQTASANLELHAAELGISAEALVDRLLCDGYE